MNPSLLSILTRPGTLVFPSNRALLSQGDESGLRLVRQPSGHVIIYGLAGRRILMADPAGNPLQECEWSIGTDHAMHMVRARLRLDWDQWIGIKPQALVNRVVLDLSKAPNWKRLSADEFRQMAARRLGLPFEEVKFFYADEDLIIESNGRVTIRQAKDAFYVLDRQTFEAATEHVRFMACMGAMHWADIDFLPVVELFQSLLPGTGNAAFELIRGLYDDQNQDRPQRSLRYRGVPPYPSEAAYKLFSTFFVPQGPAGRDPLPIFMDATRSHEVTWSPVQDPPLRYFDEQRRLCVTVQAGVVRKATLMDDPAGTSFLNVGSHGFAPCRRTIGISGDQLLLSDGDRQQTFALRPEWNVTAESAIRPHSMSEPDWRALFQPAAPRVTPREAYAAVPLYPEDDSVISEPATQPFITDYLEDQREFGPEVAAHIGRTQRVLVDGFEAGLASCISADRPRDYDVLYAYPAHAQRQAQVLWNRLAREGRLSWVPRIRLMEGQANRQTAYEARYDLAYVWIPYAHWDSPTEMDLLVQRAASALQTGALAFVTGPAELESSLRRAGLHLEGIHSVEQLPTLQMHRTILPQARVRPGLTLFHVRRS